MAIEPSLRATEPLPQRAKRLSPLPGSLVTAILGWFFGWPVVFFACLPFVTPGDILQACLVGAGSLLWLMSCYGIYGLLLRLADSRWSKIALRTSRFRTAIAVGWFFGWFPLYFIYEYFTRSLIGSLHWINVSVLVLGTVVWLVSCYLIYDLLLAIAETRWPEAKSIRETIRLLVVAFVRSHHSH